MTCWCGWQRMSAASAMKWTPQKTMYSASRPLRRVLREHERVAALIRELDDVLALVVMPEDDHPLAERRARRADAPRQLPGAEPLILLGNPALPGAERHLLEQWNRLDAGVGLALELGWEYRSFDDHGGRLLDVGTGGQMCT